MKKKPIKESDEIKKELAELRAQLESQSKPKAKAAKKEAKSKAKAAKKEAKPKAVKKEAKSKAKAIKKVEPEPEIPKTMEEELEDQYSDEELRNFRIEKKDMEQLTNRVCEILAEHAEDGMLQSDVWKRLKLTNRDGSRLSLRLERRGMITREKILQNGRWTYRLIIEQMPISLESIQNAPCLTCPVEQKCNVDNVYPEPSPKHCELIEEWVIIESKKKK